MLQWAEITGGPLQGRQLYVDTDNPTWKQTAEGLLESFTFEALDEGEGYEAKTIWDVGAFTGYHALAFAALVGQAGRVVTFEPNPFNVERIEKNLARNPDLARRVSVIPQALSDRDSQETLVLSRSIDTGQSSGSHLVDALAPEQASVYASFEELTVNTARADTLLSQARVPPPALIKMDVEGAEFMVLTGGIDMLSKVRPTLLVEIHHILTMFHVQKLLTSLDYQLTVVNSEVGVTSRCHILAKPGTR